MSTAIPDLAALKARLKGTWSAGDFGKIAESYATRAAEFIADLHMKKGERVLDVACGTGNLALPAARAGADVHGVDIAANLIVQARERAEAEGVRAQFGEGDAEDLPFPDAAFDTVLTMFGAMFAPRPEKAAAELARVCRPGGRIVMANWVPASFIGQIFKATAAHVAPPSGIPSPLLWGDEATVRDRLAQGISGIRFARRFMTFEFPFPPAEVVEHWRLYYGPTQKAFSALDAAGQAALRRDMEALWTRHNQATSGATRVESEYLVVTATRAPSS